MLEGLIGSTPVGMRIVTDIPFPVTSAYEGGDEFCFFDQVETWSAHHS